MASRCCDTTASSCSTVAAAVVMVVRRGASIGGRQFRGVRRTGTKRDFGPLVGRVATETRKVHVAPTYMRIERRG